MEPIHYCLNVILHLDTYLFFLLTHYGAWAYLALFCIIFCETGLVVFPFLPGDSLLFASGSIVAQLTPSLNIWVLFALLVIASIAGNQLNYLFGRLIGPRAFHSDSARFFNRKYLMQTHSFYEKHGGKTIIFARFIPIIRTFAPFIAGIGAMNSLQFLLYNLVSAILWIGSLLFLGYFVGGIPFIKNNFTFAIYSIVFLSLLPPVCSFLCRKMRCPTT